MLSQLLLALSIFFNGNSSVKGDIADPNLKQIEPTNFSGERYWAGSPVYVTPKRGTRSEPQRRLDIVIAHYNDADESFITMFWDEFLTVPNIKELNPYVYIYCQNGDYPETRLKGLMGEILRNGEIVHLDNKGREGRVYLYHIVHNYDQLAYHTMFSQANAGEAWHEYPLARPRMERVFKHNTGMLALSEMYYTNCGEVGWPDAADRETNLLFELYAMLTNHLCPPESYLGIYKGQFLVSEARIRSRPKELYENLLQLMEADRSHYIHSRHNIEAFKDAANPFLGHILERAWSILFRCYDPDLHWLEECEECEKKFYKDCAPTACQCLDEPAPKDKRARLRVTINRRPAS